MSVKIHGVETKLVVPVSGDISGAESVNRVYALIHTVHYRRNHGHSFDLGDFGGQFEFVYISG